MKINKRDTISFSLALILNIIIVLLIPEYKIEDVKDKKLKVGLVALEKEKTSSKEKKTTPAKKPVNKSEKFEKSKTAEKKDKSQTEKEISVPKKEEVKKEKSLSLEDVSKTIKAPSLNVINTVGMKPRKSNDVVSGAIPAMKKEIKFEREDKVGIKTDDIKFNDNLALDKEKRDTEINNIAIENNGNLLNDLDKEISTESIKVDEGKVEGLPSGYKLGVDDGDIIARWDSANQEPQYPESAQLRGLQGSVRVKLDVNEKGEVVNLIIDKGSGVPEINSAIEKIGRTWKIYLSKHGLSIKGRVILDYTFKLKGN